MTRRVKGLSTVLLVFSLILCAAGFGLAQTATATLGGQVVDSTGAAIGGAAVRVQNKDTSVTREVLTDEYGRYLIPYLNPGSYDLTVESAGFGSQTVTGLNLAVAVQRTQDIKLDVGQIAQIIDVESVAPLVETESSAVGTVVPNQQVVGLPLNARTFYSLALLSPGTLPPAQESNLGFRGGFSVAGSSEGANSFSLNGVDNNDNTINIPALRPSVEAIQEFKLVTGVASAEYGRSSGGHVNTVTKSGTNALHGSAFEFLRNQVFDAVNFFTPRGQDPGTRRNQYGGTLGGPVVVPKLYNGRDRTFFFVNYEGMGLAQAVTRVTTVPTTPMVGGDFRGLLALANPIRVVDPYTKQDFPTPNVIPASMMTALGKQLAALYPAPNAAGIGSAGPASNYVLNKIRTEDVKLFGVRLDHKMSDSDTLLGNFNYVDSPSFEPSNAKCGQATIPGFGCYQNQESWVLALGETHLFSQNVVNDFRFGWIRKYQQYWGEESFAYSGFPALPNSYSGFAFKYNAGPPFVSVQGMGNLGSGSGNPQDHEGVKYNFVDTLLWSRGSHNFKVGVDFQTYTSYERFIQFGRGGLAYNAVNASSPTTLAPTSGYSFADLLLGVPFTSNKVPESPTYHPSNRSFYTFVQDDWKVTPRLTLNLGLRYEYVGPMYDTGDNISLFNLQTLTFDVVGQNGRSRGVYNKDLNNFAPRVGLAWQPFGNSNTVVRAAGGMFYDTPPLGLGFSTGLSTQRPFRLPQTFTSTVASPLTDTNPYVPVNATGVSATTAATIDQNFRNPYVFSWSLGVQEQLTRSMALTVDYTGSKGTRLPTQVNLNQALPRTTNGVTTFVRPISGFGNITYWRSSADSAYHGLQTKLQQSYNNSLVFLLSYTYAKAISDGNDVYVSSQGSSAAQDSLNLGAERGLADFDVRHRMVFSPVYQLPLGKGRSYLQNGIAGAIAGGWQLSSITSVQTGRPFTIYNASTNRSGSLNNRDRPNISGNPNNGPKTVAQWFDTSVFSTNAVGTFGNLGRNTLRGPGFWNVDLAVQRDFLLREGLTFQFRGEAFNIFNHPNFLNPVGTGDGAFGGAAFGQITGANDPRQMQFAAKIIF